VTVAQLLAPFTPFIAEELWGNLAAGRANAPTSVHLSDYPTADEEEAVDDRLDATMAAARAIVELGRRVRVETKTRTRQPLREAVIHYVGDHEALDEVMPLVADELNVKTVVFAESESAFGRWRAKPNYQVLGPRLGARVKDVAAALANDDGRLAAALAQGQTVPLAAVSPAEPITLSPDDVDLAQEVLEGWGVASEGGLTVALDLDLSKELRREGLARELIRVVQDARKAAGLDVSDRIALGVATSHEVAAALGAHRDLIAGETLAVELVDRPLEGETFRREAQIDGQPIEVTLRRVARPSS
jgi:isoleucyl-tRNA synthetase